jgi:hypothetical protein
MSIQISESMVEHYLGDVTISWFNDNDSPPDDVKEYHNLIIWMKQNATNHNDLSYLKLAFEYLLCNLDYDCEQLAGSRYPYDDEEIREIINLAYKTIWPEDILPADAPDIQLVKKSLDDWWNR